MNIEKVSTNEYKFIFENSTSIFGNLLQKELLLNPSVVFAGYNSPHPLESKMIVKIITSDKNPKEVMINTFNNLVNKFTELENSIKSFENDNQSTN
jgi:DNA-directed RNA polymerase II subunit RPB11